MTLHFVTLFTTYKVCSLRPLLYYHISIIQSLCVECVSFHGDVCLHLCVSSQVDSCLLHIFLYENMDGYWRVSRDSSMLDHVPQPPTTLSLVQVSSWLLYYCQSDGIRYFVLLLRHVIQCAVAQYGVSQCGYCIRHLGPTWNRTWLWPRCIWNS